MSLVDKILGLITAGSAVANASVSHRLASRLADILVLTLIGSFIGGALIVGVFVAIYFGLVHYGLNPYAAGTMVALLMFVAMAAIFLLIALRMKQLRESSSKEFRRRLSTISPINIVEAFLEGLLARPR